MVRSIKKLLPFIFPGRATSPEAGRKRQEKDQNEGANDMRNQSHSNLKAESPSRSVFAPRQSIVAYATTEGDKEVNQDYAGNRCLDKCNVLAIADGVSDSLRAELAAKAAVEGFLTKIEEVLKQRSAIGREEIRDAYRAASAEIRERVEQVKQQEGLDSLNPQTTFIGIIELVDRFIFTYVGDGAIALFRADTREGVMILIPHSAPGGLTRWLDANNESPKHGYMEMDKTLEGGEIIVAGTDGALPLGKKALKTSQGILLDLKREFQEHHEKFDRDTVRRILLQKVKREIRWDDNRTLGIILTNDALDSWRKERRRESPPTQEKE